MISPEWDFQLDYICLESDTYIKTVYIYVYLYITPHVQLLIPHNAADGGGYGTFHESSIIYVCKREK